MSPAPPESTAPPDLRPLPLWQVTGLTLFSVLFFMLGPPVTAFLGIASLPRPGARYLAWLGGICMALHIGLFAFMLAMPSWYPAAYPTLHQWFPQLPPPGMP